MYSSIYRYKIIISALFDVTPPYHKADQSQDITFPMVPTYQLHTQLAAGTILLLMLIFKWNEQACTWWNGLDNVFSSNLKKTQNVSTVWHDGV